MRTVVDLTLTVFVIIYSAVVDIDQFIPKELSIKKISRRDDCGK